MATRNSFLVRLAYLTVAFVDGSAITNATGFRRNFRGVYRPQGQEEASMLLDELTLLDDLHHPQDRHRALVDEHNFFTPLTCNTPACNMKTSTWTSEAYNPAAGMVTIPCGHCIVMNYEPNASNNYTLVLPFGIDIQGSVKIPGNAYNLKKLTIITPFVRIQGKLMMDATRSTVGAEPNVKIVLTDVNSGGRLVSTSFVPAANNKYACSTTTLGTATPCTVGNKPIVVAGGQLDIQGLPPGCATWVLLKNVFPTQVDIIVQEAGVKGCWGNGAEILITSHTTDFESAQKRRIVGDPQPYATGLLRLTLDSAVIPPVTVQDGDGFAVEVALLSRNFVFEGAPDVSDDLLGGHLIVLSTPAVPQLIEGVEFRNFGRQGKLQCSLETLEPSS
jgi:hypothetical protein